MADNRTMTKGDTYPPLKGLALDEEGINADPLTAAEVLDLTPADSMQALLKSDSNLITLAATVIDPPEEDSSGDFWNWTADFDPGDTDFEGDYTIQLEVTWATGDVETFPNDPDAAPHLVIKPKNEAP